LRARFGAVYRLNFYDMPAMKAIVSRAAMVLGVETDIEGVDEIALRGRGTPRVALRLLRRVRDFAEVRANGIITRLVAAKPAYGGGPRLMTRRVYCSRSSRSTAAAR
jgi:Holliday junction DNA helicase RuvB